MVVQALMYLTLEVPWMDEGGYVGVQTKFNEPLNVAIRQMRKARCAMGRGAKRDRDMLDDSKPYR